MKNKYQIVTVICLFILLVIGCKRSEEEIREQEAIKARDAIAEELSKKFDIYPDCLFRFSTGGTNSKRLYARNCSAKKGITKPDDFLESGDKRQLKNLGFEEIEIDSWESAWKAYTTVWKFNDDGTLSFVKYK